MRASAREQLRRFRWWILSAVGTVVVAAVGWLVTAQVLPAVVESSKPVLSVVTITDPSVFEQGRPDWTGYSYIIPRPVDQIAAPPQGECRSRREWAYQQGGADAFASRFQIVLHGQRRAQVLVSDVRVVVVKQGPPMQGVWAQCPQGGASSYPVGLLVNLDDRSIRYNNDASSDADVQPLNRRLPLSISQGEVETLQVNAETKQYEEWRLQLRVTEGSGSRWITVDDHGRPFRTSALAGQPMVTWGKDGKLESPTTATTAPPAGQSARRLTDVRVGRHDTYDRVVLDFDRPIQQYRVDRDGATRLHGTVGGATLEGFSGPEVLTPHFRYLERVSVYGSVSFDIDMTGSSTYKAYLIGGTRLVVDLSSP